MSARRSPRSHILSIASEFSSGRISPLPAPHPTSTLASLALPVCVLLEWRRSHGRRRAARLPPLSLVLPEISPSGPEPEAASEQKGATWPPASYYQIKREYKALHAPAAPPPLRTSRGSKWKRSGVATNGERCCLQCLEIPGRRALRLCHYEKDVLLPDWEALFKTLFFSYSCKYVLLTLLDFLFFFRMTFTNSATNGRFCAGHVTPWPLNITTVSTG